MNNLVYQRAFTIINNNCVKTTGIDTCIIALIYSKYPIVAHIDANDPYIKQFKKILDYLKREIEHVTIEKVILFYTKYSNKEYLEGLLDWIKNEVCKEVYIKSIGAGYCLEVCPGGKYRIFYYTELLKQYKETFWSTLEDYVSILINKGYILFLNEGRLLKI